MRGLLSLTTLAMASSAAVGARGPSCTGPVKSSPNTYWLAEQDHTGNPRGYAPHAGGNYNYPVWRNVLDYSAKNDGSGDQTASLQKAINVNGSGGSRESSGVTRYPAQVYLPSGTYQLRSTLNLRVGTFIVGDLINPPVIKAAAGFNGDTLVYGYDSKNGVPETSFMTLMKNVVLDTTALRPDTKITALQWGVAQGSGLTNEINGGVVGIDNSHQQVNFKNIHFNGCTTAFKANGLGSLVLLDSTSVDSGPTIKFRDSSNDGGNRNSQILIENLSHDNGNAIAEQRTSFSTSRPDMLLSEGKFFTKAQPTYAEYASDHIVNVKAVAGHDVKGDGYTDDSGSLNAILADNAANCKISYFPYGMYIVKDTLVIPPGSRIVGEAWSVISGAGDAFKDASNPKAVVQIGSPGDVGVTEIQDMRFSVSKVLPGAKIVEVNMAGSAPGDVGLWNTVVTVGGTAETSISTTCTSQDTSQCIAAYMVMHLTESSSAYIEKPRSAGRVDQGYMADGHWLYNYNFHNAQNVYAGLLQSESPYMQGSGATQTAPAPWTADSAVGDPDFSWCDGGDQKGRTAARTCCCIIPRGGPFSTASGTEITALSAVEAVRAT
ncbi:hypothetical protein CFD26_102250 [Aspergillus turcosus]|uniref:Rhamnogalacturonase A/B/Epimerase-like pectate lyase domain-containing protein n=1 Tax=Aspergillus turcosus TaxID=1245748 RepID=A0A3R7IAN8_9EURO|nr:hypothetical protein CFD26_102250 [Aspergillus turcosus]